MKLLLRQPLLLFTLLLFIAFLNSTSAHHHSKKKDYQKFETYGITKRPNSYLSIYQVTEYPRFPIGWDLVYSVSKEEQEQTDMRRMSTKKKIHSSKKSTKSHPTRRPLTRPRVTRRPPTKRPRPTPRPPKPPRPITRPTRPPRPITRPTRPTRPIPKPTRPTSKPTRPTRPTSKPTIPTRPTSKPTRPTRPTTLRPWTVAGSSINKTHITPKPIYPFTRMYSTTTPRPRPPFIPGKNKTDTIMKSTSPHPPSPGWNIPKKNYTAIPHPPSPGWNIPKNNYTAWTVNRTDSVMKPGWNINTTRVTTTPRWTVYANTLGPNPWNNTTTRPATPTRWPIVPTSKPKSYFTKQTTTTTTPKPQTRHITQTPSTRSTKTSITSTLKMDHTTPKPSCIHHLPKYYYRSNDPLRNPEIFPHPNNKSSLPHKSLVPANEFLPPVTSCGMTLCTDVRTYPWGEIMGAVERARQFFKMNSSIDKFKQNGMSHENFTTKFDDFWYGGEAPDHRFMDDTTNCREHVNTYYPLEGSTRDERYYVVNVPSLKQGVTNIECESSFQMCSNAIGPVPKMRECRQMYRKEQLLVLPYKQSHFDIKDFELQMFRVPTGCACMRSQ